MPRYFLHLRYPAAEDGFARDEEGDELEDASALRQYVVDTARELMAGTVVLMLPFSEAIR